MKIVKITNDKNYLIGVGVKIGQYYIVEDKIYNNFASFSVKPLYLTVDGVVQNNIRNKTAINVEDCLVIHSNIECVDVALKGVEALKKLDMVHNMVHKADKWEPVKGEMIEVSDDENFWYKGIFVIKHKNMYYCENNDNDFVIIHWKYARKIEEPREVVMTVSEIEKKLGITNLKIVKE